MPKATRANDSTTPKKRTRKANPANGNGTQVAEPADVARIRSRISTSPVLEEKIRTRL